MATSTFHCVAQVSCKSRVTHFKDLHVAAFLAAAIQSCENICITRVSLCICPQLALLALVE